MEEHFYGLTLTTNQIKVWNPESDPNYHSEHKLVIKSVLLGPEAVEDELNVVHVKTSNWRRPTVFIPITALKAGKPSPTISLDLSFLEGPVTFALVQGNGPVHFIGSLCIKKPMLEKIEALVEEEQVEENEEEEDQEEELDNEE